MCATPQFVSAPSDSRYNITFDREGKWDQLFVRIVVLKCLNYDLACNPTVTITSVSKLQAYNFCSQQLFSGTFHIINRDKTILTESLIVSI